MVKELSAELEKLNVAQDERVTERNQLVTNESADRNQLVTNESADNGADIDVDLSDLAVDLLVLAQELIEAKVRLEEMTKNGWMCMAKARYVMGQTTVSALQLPTADDDTEEYDFINATTTVDTQECTRDDNGILGYHQFSLKYKSEESNNSPNKIKDGLRLRKPENQDEGEQKGSGIQELSKVDKKRDKTKDHAKNMNDPLRWFSVMPPAPLKQSQKCFQSALGIVVEIANIQSEIKAIQGNIQDLKRKKLEH